jgi:hypothetical protein
MDWRQTGRNPLNERTNLFTCRGELQDWDSSIIVTLRRRDQSPNGYPELHLQ